MRILKLHNLITREGTWEDIELVQGSLELARRPLIIPEGPYISGLAPVGAEKLSLLLIRLLIVQNWASIDVNQGLFAVWVVNAG